MTMEALRAIVRFVTDTTYEDIPSEVVQQTKIIMLDTIGCGLAGYVTETGQIVRNLVRSLGGRPESTIIVNGEKNSCAHAAFANAKMSNALDMDDCFMNMVHFAPITVFTPLAFAESVGATGKDLIEAVALGYDIAARVALYGGHVFYTGCYAFMCHIFGSVISGGKILKLNEEQMANAICLAAQCAPVGVLKTAPVTWMKYGDAGMIAWTGIVSCLLAKGDYRATLPTLFEGDDGYWRAMRSVKPNYSALTDKLAQKWWIMESVIKSYPCCRHNHNPIDMFNKIVKENKIKPEEIESIVIKSRARLADPKRQWAEEDPKDSYGAQFSIPHCIAMAAFNVPIGPQWQASENIDDPKVKEFRKKVKLLADPKADEVIADQKDEGFPKRMPISIELIANGKVYYDRRELTKGDPWSAETKLSYDDIREKFVMNASNVFQNSKIKEVIETLERIEEVDNIKELMKLLSQPKMVSRESIR
jgi:2-methylcitrate dehydratase PrpD